jgi:hypothetical protein
MLLHDSYINVAITVILMGRNSLYDLPVQKCKNLRFTEKGCGNNAQIRQFLHL